MQRDIRIRNRVMAVLGALKGHSTKIASDFTNVDQQTVQLWAARFDEGGIGGLRDAPGRLDGKVRRLSGMCRRHRWPPGRSRQGQGFPCKVRADQETGRQASGRFFRSLDELKAAITAILEREMGNRLKGYLVALSNLPVKIRDSALQ